MIHNIFFDLDRTLWDFEKNSEATLLQLFEQTKSVHQIPSFHKFHLTYKEINSSLWKKYGKGKISKDELRDTRFKNTFLKFGINNPELNEFFNEEYIRISPLQKQLFPNTKETLQSLKEEGYKMHVITNGFKEVQFTKLENCGLIDFFEVIVSSEEVGFNKPDIRIFNYAIEQAKAINDKSLMIGDDYEVDVIGAEKCGMKAVHFAPHLKVRNAAQEGRINDLIQLPEIIPFL
ncbi:MAG TPA: YjjG family noncanonical pyrimidine nucleotidase [Taishania sp.]|nr:YjjG family noncanonical pyrimidine nucleotidase [Taishania sp.]